MNWIEYHTDTRYSDVLSFFGAEDVILQCAQHGCRAAAVTDRNTVQGYLIAEREAAKRGISLIYGVTVDCLDREDRYAVTLLAKNQIGRENIFALLRLMDDNDQSLGNYVTRQQLEVHRAGLLLGASARDGQLVRAIQLHRSDACLKKVVLAYDYVELPLEPYDVSARLCRIAHASGVPVCAVQNATVSGNERAWYHAHRAITQYWGRSEEAAFYRPPEELAEDFRELYILPEEREIVEKALSDNQQWIFNQIEPMPALQKLMQCGQDAFHQKMMVQLRKQAQAALTAKYGSDAGPAIQKRLEQELEDIDRAGAAGIIHILQEVRAVLPRDTYLMIPSSYWNTYFLLYLLDITDVDPLPQELSETGHALLYLPGFYGKNELCSVDIRISGQAYPLVMERLGKTCNAFLAYHNRKTRDSEETRVAEEIAQNYLKSCSVDFRAELENQFSFFAKTLQHGSGYPSLIEWTKVHLIPNMDHLPVKRFSPLPELALDSFGGVYPYFTLCSFQLAAALEACQEKTGILRKDIPLDDPLVFQAIRSCGMMTEAVCRITGFTERFAAQANCLAIHDFSGLLRVYSLNHGTAIWENNQEPMLRDGTITPAQVITCREDVYRYLVQRGAAPEEAAEFMTCVRRGLAARKGFSDAQKKMLRRCGAEEWFISVCRTVAYLFSEGHCLPFAVCGVQLMWYALHESEAVGQLLIEIAEEAAQQEKRLEDYYAGR